MVADDSALSLEPDFGIRLRALAALEGAVLTEDELSHLGESYPGCRGKGQWDVREYVCHTGVGAREYRVVRASSVQYVYRSTERMRAAAVGAALNVLESGERSREENRSPRDHAG
ncbi:MAG TPA: hypothetical protein VF882_01330 [Gemmatimonadales bacterium]